MLDRCTRDYSVQMPVSYEYVKCPISSGLSNSIRLACEHDQPNLNRLPPDRNGPL